MSKICILNKDNKTFGYVEFDAADKVRVAQQLKDMSEKESKALTKAKKVGLKVTEVNPERVEKLNDFIAKTEGNKVSLATVYRELEVGKKPTDKKLAKRYDAAQKRLKAKGLL